MLRVIAFGLAAGAAIQAWRQFPAHGPMTQDSVALVFVVGVLLAYVGGRWGARATGARAEATAVAVSSSTATAENRVQLAIFTGDMSGAGGAAAAAQGVRVPASSAPWFAGTAAAPELQSLDGLELSELVEDFDREHVD